MSSAKNNSILVLIAIGALWPGAVLAPGATEEWVARYNAGVGYDYAEAIALDGSGNVYVTGYATGGSGLGFEYATLAYSPTGAPLWAGPAIYNGPIANGADGALAIAARGSGTDARVYVTGVSWQGVTQDDIVTIKYNSAGVQQWVPAPAYDGGYNLGDQGNDIAVDASGNVYVTGFRHTSSSATDLVVLKYNSTGTLLWARTRTTGYGTAIALDSSGGNVYVTGGTGVDCLTIKYTAGGTKAWEKTYNGPSGMGDGGDDIAVDGSGNAYVTGHSYSTTTQQDIVTLKYNASGTQLWAVPYDFAGGDDFGYAIAVDADGNAYVTGESEGTEGTPDYVTIKYNTSGQQLWASRYDGSAGSDDVALGLALDNETPCNIYVTGESKGIGEGWDYATVMYDPNGVEQWVMRYTGTVAYSDDRAQAIAVYDSDNIYVTGYSGGDYATIKYSGGGSQPTGACCVDMVCVATTTFDECVVLDGDWYEGETCPDFGCPTPPKVWYFDDAGVQGWGQTGTAPYWEWMDAGPLPECTMYDLWDPNHPYYAASHSITYDYSGYRFYAEIWLANNYAEYVEPVTVELRKGSWGNEGTLIASATAYVTEVLDPDYPGWPHIFDFGTICDLVLDNESLVLKIIYYATPGNTHIYWNGEYCPSALHALAPDDPPGLDTVVCEPRGGANPSHPSTYWYDVTPGDAYGRCDFHVRVYDPNPANYTPGPPPAATWSFAVHQVGSEWWASWWDQNCVNPITGPFRFQFTNSSPRAWGDWRVTIGASVNPHVWVSDFNGTHFMQPDGYGGRVHVPATASSDSFTVMSQPNLVGVWKSDSAWGDFDGDGDLDLVIAGVTAAGTRVTKTYENHCGALVLRQDLVGVESESSGNLAWGDYDGDGDLDLALAGTSDSGPLARIYENDGAGNLTWDSTQVLTGVHYASVAWGDYDLDGDLDLFIQGYDGTQNRAILYENQPLGPGAPGLTPDASQSLTALRAGSADWGDFDGDGDLDLLLTGHDGSNYRTIFYKNHPVGTLTDTGNHGLPGVALSDAALGDMDGDGDLDLAITGEDGTNRHAHVYRNDGAGNLTQVGGDLMTIYRSSCAWGDYDNDGDLDVAFCGYDGGWAYGYIFRNTGSGFTSVYDLAQVREGSLNWVDVDGDGKLDLFLTGGDFNNNKYARVYQKTGGIPNTTPTAPSLLTSDQCSGLSLDWSGMIDPETGSPGLYYAVRVGTTSGAEDVMSGTYSTPLMGNAGQGATYWLGLPAHQYFWSVQTIDSGFEASPWAPEQVAWCKGDVNCDGCVGFGDINPFVLLLSNPAAYQAAYPNCPLANGDINCDGTVDFGDINPFVAILAGGVCGC